MKKIILTIAMLAMFASAAYAACTTTTIFIPGQVPVICTTCCYAGNCTVTCN